jgi:Skp family chaperone for outer membrane proteins
MVSSKRTRHDENSFAFIDVSTLAPKRPRRTAQLVTLAEVRNLQQERAERDAKEAEDLKESIAKAAEERRLAESKLRVETVLRSITVAGYESLYSFVGELLNTRDQQLSARVSRMLGCHGDDILNSIRARQPDLVKQWTLKVSGEILAKEGQKLQTTCIP